jgi:hypothetical protein
MKALVLVAAITAVALAMAFYQIGAVTPPSGFYPTNWTDAQLIRNRFHVRLVQPEWVSSNGSILMNWVIAETKARLIVIAIFWLCAVIFAIRYEMGGNENVDAN